MLERDLMAQITTPRERGLFGACIYCGTPCRGLACRGHRDLLEHDPEHVPPPAAGDIPPQP